MDGRTDEENAVYTHNGILFSLYKGGNPATGDRMDEPQDYAEWNEPDTEGETLPDSTYVKCPKQCEKQEGEKWLPGPRGGEWERGAVA